MERFLSLPNNPEEPTELVIPSAPQMGWTLYPCFFHVASEIARDVDKSYAHEGVGTLLDNIFKGNRIS